MKRRDFVATVSLGLHPSPGPARRCDELHLCGRPVFTLVRNDELSGCPVDQSAGLALNDKRATLQSGNNHRGFLLSQGQTVKGRTADEPTPSVRRKDRFPTEKIGSEFYGGITLAVKK